MQVRKLVAGGVEIIEFARDVLGIHQKEPCIKAAWPARRRQRAKDELQRRGLFRERSTRKRKRNARRHQGNAPEVHLGGNKTAARACERTRLSLGTAGRRHGVRPAVVSLRIKTRYSKSRAAHVRAGPSVRRNIM